MVDGLAHYAKKGGDTQQLRIKIILIQKEDKLFWVICFWYFVMLQVIGDFSSTVFITFFLENEKQDS